MLGYNRLEGFDVGKITIQGARAVDNTIGQWTTPDAYAGTVHDPMSQKAFMWDNNNPYSYFDPPGFAPQQYAQCSGCRGGYWSIETAEQVAREQRERSEAVLEGYLPIAVGISADSTNADSSSDVSDGLTPHVGVQEIQISYASGGKKRSSISGKEAASNRPSWSYHYLIFPGESAQHFATRILDDKYGEGKWKRGSGSEYSQIVKAINRKQGGSPDPAKK